MPNIWLPSEKYCESTVEHGLASSDQKESLVIIGDCYIFMMVNSVHSVNNCSV